LPDVNLAGETGTGLSVGALRLAGKFWGLLRGMGQD